MIVEHKLLFSSKCSGGFFRIGTLLTPKLDLSNCILGQDVVKLSIVTREGLSSRIFKTITGDSEWRHKVTIKCNNC